ncbi:hypothetical protein [Streptomyces sp. NPDC096323]|uniref:hypothetical protein n=1 Tax=Streptomyces sp. NPDC096323 TaxID=3155822 RepID=UPI003318F07B
MKPYSTEGQASLIAESLAEALTLAIVLPSWHDALAGFRPPALNADYLEDNPDHPEVRDRLLAALRLPPATAPEVLARLLTTAARTVPDGPFGRGRGGRGLRTDAPSAGRVGQPRPAPPSGPDAPLRRSHDRTARLDAPATRGGLFAEDVDRLPEGGVRRWCHRVVLQAPAPVIAEALGYHDKTATRQGTEAGGNWSRYAPGDHSR